MSFVLRFLDVTFGYPESPGLIIDSFTGQFHRGWTGVVGPNGAGKTTLLRLASRELSPTRGTVPGSASAVYCAQRTDAPPPGLRDLLTGHDAPACQLRGRLGLEEDWLARWNTLSHGERKRAQIGVALWRQPQVLAVDEPTNHLDRDAAHQVASALQSFGGIGLLVSHDRELLDLLCAQCLFVDPQPPILRPGTFTQADEQAALERDAARSAKLVAGSERKRLEREAAKRRAVVDRSRQRLSKRGIPKGDHDAKAKRDLAKLTGKDGRAGRQLRQVTTRVERAREAERSIEAMREPTLGIWMAGEASHRRHLFHRPADRIEVSVTRESDGWRLTHPELTIGPQDRVALSGPNGSGKSTLVRHILEHLELPADRLVYLPQEIEETRAREILAKSKGTSRDQLGRLMAIVKRLGSDPERLLESSSPSPGELRKLLLAYGVARLPHLIVLDEPTNHLDLPSIQSLENALSDCPCALLLVSHDERFLSALASLRWNIHRTAERSFELVLGGPTPGSTEG
ncbi:MAG: ATP-binding cassette domain-containing protein [Candidatus Eisenbacteria bacterium]